MIDQRIVKNVILDLGGVLVDIEPEQTVTALKRIIQPHHHDTIKWDETPEVVYAMETGRWNKQQFIDHFQEVCKPDCIEEEIIDAWCAMILEFPTHRVDLVKQLAEKYNLFLLSNTNVFHIKYFEKEFKYRYNHSIHKLFSKVYYSSEIGLRKPDVECFQFVLNDAGIKPEETVMVDDLAVNCKAAELVGMHSLKVPGNCGLEAVIKYLL
jgi:putative hydrolase of the HAD superfamily